MTSMFPAGTLRSLAIGAIAVLSLTLTTGCSTGTPEPVTTAGEGVTITTDTFSFETPGGWVDARSLVGQEMIAAVRDEGDTDGFADNLNVGPFAVPFDSLDEVEQSAQEELASGGAKSITIEPRVQIDGVDAGHISAELKNTTTTFRIDQYYVLAAGGLTITYSSNVDLTAPERQASIDAIFSTWKWR